MSFSRVKPDGWAVNEKLTSAQQNQLDIDHAKAVDKTGDTIAGILEFVSPARLNMRTGTVQRFWDGAALDLTGTSSLNVYLGGTINLVDGFLTVGASSTATFACSIAANGGIVSTTGSFSSTLAVAGASTFSGNVTMQGTGSLGSRLVNIQNGADVRVKTGSRIYFENGSSVYFDTSVGIDMLADIAFGTGHTSSYPNGSQIFFQGASTHTSTSVDTYATGSQTVHASASTDTYQSGALLTQSSGSIWTMGGTTNLASGGVLHLQGGSVVTFTSVPTFANGLTVSSGTTAIAGTCNVSATTNLSGTTTIVGSSNRLQMTPRSVTKRLVLSRALVIQSGSPVSFNYDITSDTVEIGTGSTIILDLDIPDGAMVTEIEYTWTGTGNTEAALRANSVLVGGAVTNSSPGTYTISTTENILRATTAYRFTFRETSTNVPKLTSVSVTYSVSEYSEG